MYRKILTEAHSDIATCIWAENNMYWVRYEKQYQRLVNIIPNQATAVLRYAA